MRALLTISLITLTACTSYRGVGPYRAADYVGGGESVGTLDAPDPRPPGEPALTWPVAKAKVNRGFRPASDPRHVGVDLGGELGTPILAAHDGRVVYAGHDFRGYGNMVLLEYDDHWATLYAHLSRVRVDEGLMVHRGDLLGLMGRTGHATGVHLHFEVMRDRRPVDPLALLSAPRVRGLATARGPSSTRER